MPDGAVTGAARNAGDGVVVTGIDIAAADREPAITDLSAGLPSPEVFQRRAADSPDILPGRGAAGVALAATEKPENSPV